MLIENISNLFCKSSFLHFFSLFSIGESQEKSGHHGYHIRCDILHLFFSSTCFYALVLFQVSYDSMWFVFYLSFFLIIHDSFVHVSSEREHKQNHQENSNWIYSWKMEGVYEERIHKNIR